MIRLFCLSAALVGALAVSGEAMAFPYCTDAPDIESNRRIFGSSAPSPEAQRRQADLMALRQLGVDATYVDTWNGCLRAFVRVPGHGTVNQFFDPITYRRVY